MENTNKSIAVNTVILYIRLIIISVCGLFTTRFALRALGVVDYGLYTVLGGIVSLISVVNSIMLVTSNRFIGVAIGKGDVKEANEQFIVNLIIHLSVALTTIILLLPLGRWYILHFVHYEGDINTAVTVFIVSIIGASISFLGVPYNGLLMAKENFFVFSFVDIISHILKLVLAVALVFLFTHKLFIYAIGMAVCSIFPTVVYALYCNRKYPNYVQIRRIPVKKKMREVLSFSVWSGYGAVASVAKNQGASLLINAFFDTVMNTALGIANSINHYVILFAQNVTKPVSPQITKNYAAGNFARCETLLVFVTKTAFLFMFFISFPFLMETEYILGLWLGQVPPGSVLFTRLLIIEALIDSLNNGISEVVFAYGKIAFYQVTTNTARLVAILVAFILLKSGFPAQSLLYSYIGITILVFFLKQYSLSRVPGINNIKVVTNSYIPSLIIVIISIPALFISFNLHPIVHIVLGLAYLCVAVFFIGLKKSERRMLLDYVKRRISND